MPKFDFGTAVAFGTQSGEGTGFYNSTLDGITSGGGLTAAQGLVTGDSGSGIRESGLSFGLERSFREKALIGSTYSRALSDFLKAEVPTFTFGFPFVGNRADADGGPNDADATPIAGIDAILEGAGLEGALWGTGVGWSYKFGSPNPISALVYISGMRLELLDCRVALSIDFDPGSIPVATATIAVGSIKEQTVAALPTLTPGEQSTVSAPVVEDISNTWQELRGFSTGTLNIGNTISDIGDSNALSGFVKEITDRDVTFDATLFADDEVNAGYEYSQLIAAAEGTLDQLSFQVGDNMTTGNPAEAVQVLMPKPELATQTLNALGTRAAYDVSLIARGSVGNDELEIIFR